MWCVCCMCIRFDRTGYRTLRRVDGDPFMPLLPMRLWPDRHESASCQFSVYFMLRLWKMGAPRRSSDTKDEVAGTRGQAFTVRHRPVPGVPRRRRESRARDVDVRVPSLQSNLLVNVGR